MPKAYPVYDGGYADALRVVRDFERHSHLQLVGRNGMHKYNNRTLDADGNAGSQNILGANYTSGR